MKETYSKHWDNKHGFTYKEALEKKAKVEEGLDLNDPKCKWNPAVIEPDPDRVDGYRVVRKTKSEKD